MTTTKKVGRNVLSYSVPSTITRMLMMFSVSATNSSVSGL